MDKTFVQRLAHDLRSYRLRVWFDQWQLLVGDSLADKIQEGIDESSFLIVVLSPTSIRSKWVGRELNAAFEQEIEGQLKILPIVLRRCRIPVFLRDKVHADFSRSYTKALGELLLSILGQKAYERLVRLPADVAVENTKDLEESLCLILENKRPTQRHYHFPFFSLLTLPPPVFRELERRDASRSNAKEKKRRWRLGREGLDTQFRTHDLIEEPRVVEYLKTGRYWNVRLPKASRRIHIEHVLDLLDGNSNYEISVSRARLGQWFLTYAIAGRKLSYLSRSYEAGEANEPTGVFSRSPGTFLAYERLFQEGLQDRRAVTGRADVSRYLERLLSRHS